jgi:LemA protein
MIIWIIIIAIVVLLVIWFIASYNGLVRLRNRIDAAWSQIGVQLERRHDLIPNLVETVKGYAAHERGTLEGVVQARNAAIEAKNAGPEQQAQAENVLTGALRQLFALAEAYPDLKANQNLLSLQEELTATEDRISYSRQFYNDEVLKYDNKLETIPSKFIAGMFNFMPREYFKAEEGATEVPRVQF